MSDPKLKKACVEITYEASDGYRSGFSVRSGRGTGHPPETAMLAAVEELARLLALFGFEDEARSRVGAFARVAEWRKNRKETP